MQQYDSHISDRELLLAADGELGVARAAEIRDHLAGCPSCWMRNAELEQTLADVVQAHQRGIRRDAASHGKIAEHCCRRAWRRRGRRTGRRRCPVIAWRGPLRWSCWSARLRCWQAGPFVAALRRRRNSRPMRRGRLASVRPLTRDAVCSAPDRDEPGPVISAAVAREVFRRYGIRNPRPRSYEVDYLIPPALGGSDDPRNLWPQPYSAGVWNARVKDALEDRLRALVCGGKLDLATAQNDLARDWIAAYKKYFRTGTPLLDHVAFVKDRPWE